MGLRTTLEIEGYHLLISLKHTSFDFNSLIIFIIVRKLIATNQ